MENGGPRDLASRACGSCPIYDAKSPLCEECLSRIRALVENDDAARIIISEWVNHNVLFMECPPTEDNPDF